MKKNLFPLAMAFALFIGGCSSEHLEPQSNVCFEGDVLPIFQSHCTQSGCHNARDREANYDLSNYTGILSAVKPGEYRHSEAYTVLVPPFNSMPQGSEALTDAQLTTIAIWIEEGALNTTNCQAACDTTVMPTFSGSVRPVLDKYCTGCHAGSTPQGGIDLSNYSGVKSQATNGALVGSVAHTGSYSYMPKDGSPLSTCQTDKIKKWVDLGAKND